MLFHISQAYVSESNVETTWKHAGLAVYGIRDAQAMIATLESRGFAFLLTRVTQILPLRRDRYSFNPFNGLGSTLGQPAGGQA